LTTERIKKKTLKKKKTKIYTKIPDPKIDNTAKKQESNNNGAIPGQATKVRQASMGRTHQTAKRDGGTSNGVRPTLVSGLNPHRKTLVYPSMWRFGGLG